MSKSKSVNEFLNGLLNEAAASRPADKKGTTLDAAAPGTKVADPSDSNLSSGGPDQTTKSKEAFDNENKLNNVGTKTAAKRKADKSGVKLEEKEDDKKETSDGGSDGASDKKKDDKKEKKNPFMKEAAEGKSDGGSDGEEDDADDKKKMKEHVDAMFEGQETLPEEFKSKATLVFEAAVSERVAAARTELEESFMAKLDEEVESVKTDLVEKVNDYMDFIVEQWTDDNKLAIESALRAELSESLMQGLKELFEAHYIDLPEEKVDSIGELTEKNASLEESLNEQMTKNIELNKAYLALQKKDIFNQVAEGLADTEKDKLKTLCESVESSSLEDYKAKVETIKSSYYSSKTKTGTVQDINEATHTDNVASNDDNNEIVRIANYASRMKR